ncbi:hypothetical protein FB45DRAFT_1009697 [Roridomyces roridus]|uniref:F-box domain-containing protein n=1 Tax=Roridomyces roridus TaxID=1738132 RepID=A0AAD7B5K4_9AGAR|nr:hypothetical protein FB45DRAFT_1009697 [Roridomyces roridus]
MSSSTVPSQQPSTGHHFSTHGVSSNTQTQPVDDKDDSESGDGVPVASTQALNDAETSGSFKEITTYTRRLPSQAFAAEQREILPVTDATRQREHSFSLAGTTRSPIQKLPIELLHAIFFACLPSDKYAPVSSRFAPLVVSWICRYWRRVALALPALWASLALECGSSTPQEHCDYLSTAFKCWISRVGRYPLSVSLRSRAIRGKELRDVGVDYTSFLTIEGVMHTCTSLDFGLPITAGEFHILMRHAFTLISASFSSVTSNRRFDNEPIEVEHLQTLEITITCGYSESALTPLVLPALTTLRLIDRGPPAVTWAAAAALAQRSSACTDSLGLTELSHTRSHNGPAHWSSEINMTPALFALVSHPAMQNLERLALRERAPLATSAAFSLADTNLKASTLAVFARPGTLPKLRELVLETCAAPDGVLSDVIGTRMEGFLDHSEDEQEEECGEGQCVRLKKLEVEFSSLELGGKYECDRGRLSALAEQVGFALVIRPVVRAETKTDRI